MTWSCLLRFPAGKVSKIHCHFPHLSAPSTHRKDSWLLVPLKRIKLYRPGKAERLGSLPVSRGATRTDLFFCDPVGHEEPPAEVARDRIAKRKTSC